MSDYRYQTEKKIEESLVRLDSWIEEYGWEGWDPYDIKGEAGFRRIQSVPLASPLVRLFIAAFPYQSRRVFRIEKRAYPEAMAALTHAYLNLHRLLEDGKHLERARSCLDWLEKNRCQRAPEYCWGAAFDWDYEGLFIPRGTPDSTATSMVAGAFFKACKEMGERRYLKIAESACGFLLRGLNIDRFDDESICFSYTPLDSTHVHNANLFNAAILAMVGEELENQRFVEFARKATNYTVGQQNPDGSWYYRGPPDSRGKHIDNYHTGFVLRNLCYLYRVFGGEEIKESIVRGYDYYRKNLFSGSIPRLTPQRLYPVDIYSCAEAINCMAALSQILPGALEDASKVAEWTIDHMQDRRGYFYYRRYRAFTHKFPFIRWGQAIMLEALSSLLRVLRNR